jgi:transposase-like protein
MTASGAPKCPWCAKPMTFVQATPGAGGGPAKHRFECKRCIIVYTELERSGERAPERVRKLNGEPIRTLQ